MHTLVGDGLVLSHKDAIIGMQVKCRVFVADNYSIAPCRSLVQEGNSVRLVNQAVAGPVGNTRQGFSPRKPAGRAPSRAGPLDEQAAKMFRKPLVESARVGRQSLRTIDALNGSSPRGLMRRAAAASWSLRREPRDRRRDAGGLPRGRAKGALIKGAPFGSGLGLGHHAALCVPDTGKRLFSWVCRVLHETNAASHRERLCRRHEVQHERVALGDAKFLNLSGIRPPPRGTPEA